VVNELESGYSLTSAWRCRDRRLSSEKLIAEETEKWAKVIKSAGIKPQ
jgi:hypothetical protein